MRSVAVTQKIFLVLSLLLFVRTSSPFSVKSLCKKFFAIKKNKDAAQKDNFIAHHPEPKQSHESQQPLPADEQKSSDRPIITVWIHGTSRHFMRGGSLKKDDPRGLLKMEVVEESQRSKKAALALMECDAQHYPDTSFYFFRWSGKLSYKEREAQAHALYQELATALQQCRDNYGIEPYVRIIAHSHGGNVALNLAKVAEGKDDFWVDQLVLMGCPVQETTADLIQSPVFKKVFVLYSTGDFLQVAAPQGLGFSGRHFPDHHNVVQAKVKVKGKSPGHFEFIKPEFMPHLAVILTRLEQQQYAGSRVRVNSH